MVHTMKRNFGAVSTAAFLSTRNGVLQEQQIHADDIKAYPAIAEKNIELDPRIYDTVPQYIVDVCDQAINELREVHPA